MPLHRDVAPGVHRVAESRVNWYLVEDEGRITVVDCGLPRSWDSLSDALRALGRTLGDVEAVVVTHAHFDHVGFGRRIARDHGVPVWIHEADASLARRPWFYRQERPLPLYLWRPATVTLLAEVARSGALWQPPLKDLRTFGSDAGALDVPGRPVVVPTPGHTGGHVAFHLPDRGALVTGDALVTLDPYSGRPGPRLVARAATADSDLARASLRRIGEVDAKVLLPGHGEPWHGSPSAAARAAAAAPVA